METQHTATPSTSPLRVVEIDGQRSFHPKIYWYLTFRCNLSCAHCWVGSSPRVDTSGDLSTEEAMRVVDQMADLEVSACTLSGGEVLTRPDALDVIEALCERGIPVMVETNAVLIRDRFIDTVSRLLGDGAKLGFGISLDGATAETHERLRGPRSFARTVRNLHRLRDAGIHFNLQCTLNRCNIGTIPQLYELAADLRPALDCLGFCLLNPLGRGEELARELGVSFADLDEILTLVAEHRQRFDGATVVKAPPAAIPPRHLATALNSSLVSTLVTCQFPLLGVLPNGDVTICALSRDNRELHFGNVRETTLEEIWQHTRLGELRHRYLAADTLDGICGDCIWNRGCRGSCRAWAYEEGASFDAPYPLCAALDAAGEFPDAYRRSVVGVVPPELAAGLSPACGGCGGGEVSA